MVHIENLCFQRSIGPLLEKQETEQLPRFLCRKEKEVVWDVVFENKTREVQECNDVSVEKCEMRNKHVCRVVDDCPPNNCYTYFETICDR